jgi:hypothetical protein
LTTGSGSGFLVADGVSATYSRAAGTAVGTYHITAALSATVAGALDNYTITNNGNTFTVNPDPTQITLDAKSSGTNFECVNQYTATLKDTFTNGGISGVVLKLNIGTQGPVTATTDASGVATFTLTLNQTPGTVTESVGLNAAWSDGNRTAPTAASRSFTVNPSPNVGPVSNASTLYTGSRFFWTTSPTSSTATLTLTATIRDSGVCGGDLTTRGDITKAKVSFAISSNDGQTFSPVSSGQNLPVGLVDPADHTIGTTSIISQYNLGKDKAAQLWVKVTVGGEYIMNSDVYDVPVTVAVPGQANSLLAGGGLANDGVSLAGSSGFLASGAFGVGDGLHTGAMQAGSVDFGGQVVYSKSLTNPQGQLTLIIHSYNKPDGTQDGAQHTYFVKSNSIANLALVGNPGTARTASFSSKTNVYELLSGSRSGLDGGGVMQFMFTQPGGTYQVSSGTGSSNVTLTCPTGSQGCASVIAYKSAGGVWFSSAWGPVTTGGVPQTVEKQMKTGGQTFIN